MKTHPLRNICQRNLLYHQFHVQILQHARFSPFLFQRKKNRDRQREILLQRSELCRGDTREMCLDGPLLGPGGAAKSTCTTYDQKLRMMYRQTQCTEAIEKRNKRRKTGIESTDRMHTLCLVLGLISSLVWEREAAGLLAVEMKIERLGVRAWEGGGGWFARELETQKANFLSKPDRSGRVF